MEVSDEKNIMYAKGNFIALADRGGTATININMLPEKPKFVLQRPSKIKHFTDREKELKKIIENLKPDNVVTLCGPAGIGKSALASKAIHEIFSGDKPPTLFPDGILQYDFYRDPSVQNALEDIALSLGEEPRPTPFTAAQRALAGRKCLILLDGAEEADYLQLILDAVGNNGVLITSRNNDDAVDDWYDIEILKLNEAVKLLLSWSNINIDNNNKDVYQICELIGGLPLAIRIAGRYIHRKKKKSADYLEWLKSTPLDALDHGKRKLESVPILLKRSLEQVSEDAVNILGIAGILAFASFSKDIIQKAMPDTFIEKLLDELIGYGLLDRVEERFVITHALIHTYARKNHKPDDGIVERVSEYYVSYVREYSEQGGEVYAIIDMERAHIMRIMEECKAREIWQRIIDLVQVIDSYLHTCGYWTKRLNALQLGLEAARNLNSHKNEGEFLIFQGLTYSNLGKVEDAINYYEEALNISKSTGDKHIESLVMGCLGFAYKKLCNIGKAINYYEKALIINREISENKQNECMWLEHLGTAYSDLGQIEKAIQYYEQALIVRKECGFKDDGTIWGNLGIEYNKLGQIEKAIEYYEQTLVISRELGHRLNECAFLGNIGIAYKDLGRLEKAIECHEKALSISFEIKSRHEESKNLNNLGLVYKNLGQIEKAIAYYEQALIISREIGDRMGEGITLGNIAGAYIYLKKFTDAIFLAKQGLQIAIEIRDSLSEAFRNYEIGLAYYNLGRYVKGKRYLESSLSLFEKNKSPYADLIKKILNRVQSI